MSTTNLFTEYHLPPTHRLNLHKAVTSSIPLTFSNTVDKSELFPLFLSLSSFPTNYLDPLQLTIPTSCSPSKTLPILSSSHNIPFTFLFLNPSFKLKLVILPLSKSGDRDLRLIRIKDFTSLT
ncbi:hypothetical protein L873DRAFT_1808954 [Choiromyces venosus 120613-1]|uniref:Uncharacterized protein n=1 Tax=Choiromyces venosus 120613-1 TaxID=1336337 RepID=A0A3N4JIH8_9PEZI|nr:hypothetical protein L873DRAFT_1808954 [Choiromyces venosus 120613-1]